MTKRKQRIATLLAAFMLPLALSVTVAETASAHGDEAHQSATPSAPSDTQNQDMTGMDMSGAVVPAGEMAWPTGDEDGGMMMGHHPRPTTFGGRVIAWLGAWHPAIIHFPIALLLTVAFLELAAIARRKPLYNASNKILLGIGVLGAFAAAPLGWADAGMPTAQDEWFLTAHRWLGTFIPFLFLLLWRLKKPAEQAAIKPSPPFYEALLAISVAVILAQAFLGGEITHGANHMAF